MSLLYCYFCYLEGENKEYRRNFPAKRDARNGETRTMKEGKKSGCRSVCYYEEGAEGIQVVWTHFLGD